MDDGLPEGHLIGHYRVVRELGRGGFGITYLAQDTRLHRHVAIKEYFPPNWAWRADSGVVIPRTGEAEIFAEGLQRFWREARVLAQVDHPNIVRVHCSEEQHGTGYIVMEFVEGESLSKRLNRLGTLAECDIRQYVLPIMDGLGAVHDEDFLHLDVAPKNIMLTPCGRGVLLDFGAAQTAQRAATGEATIMITPSCAALEQHRGEPLSAATDIYGLGAVLYRCVAGHFPEHPVRRVEDDRMRKAADAAATYSANLLSMIDAALAVRSEDRPQSISDLQSCLSASVERKPRSLDPEMILLGVKVAGFHIEAGARKFSDYAEAMRQDLGDRFDEVKDYLRSWYEAIRHFPNTEFARDMSDAADIDQWYAAEDQYERGSLAHNENDWDKAESWYTRAAEQGHAKAQFDLAMMYFDGEIEGMDIGDCVEHAVSYCIDAARAGLDCAKAFLERGIEVGLKAYRVGDYYEAELEFRRLAEQGQAQALFRLAQMYIFATPESCADDRSAFDQARRWLEQAAQHGCASAEYALVALLTGGYAYWLDVDPSDVGDGGATATYWYWKAAQRAPSEQYAMGLRSEGDTEHADRDEAAFWYRFAGHQGHINAEFRLGLLAFCRLYGELEDAWGRRDVGWKLLLDAACHGQPTAMALIWDGKVLGVEGEMEISAEDPAVPARPSLSRPPRNATFPGFADEMLAESDVCKNEPRLLARLYDSYRRAATKAGVPWAKDFSSDVEIDSWYNAYELSSRKHP